ncbi:MAG: Hpt domain-containing protein [Planctomycetaceae bacterium]
MSAPTSRFGSADEVPLDAGVDLQAALRRLGGDAELVCELAQIVVEDAPGLLAQALSARAAGALDARNSGDFDAAARAAHALKGLLANFSEPAAGAAQLAETVLRQRDAASRLPALANLQAYTERLLDELQRTVLTRD